jgi:hypothetical protein
MALRSINKKTAQVLPENARFSYLAAASQASSYVPGLNLAVHLGRLALMVGELPTHELHIDNL